MNAVIPEQLPEDIALARALYPHVAKRSCFFFNDSGKWEECFDRWAGSDRLWCVSDDRNSWAVVPAYGADEAAAWDALRRYCERKGLYFQLDYLPPEGDSPAERTIIIQRLGGAQRVAAEGSTFALAARAAILAMEGL